MENILEIILQYGAIGVILLYFVWKDTQTFAVYKESIKEIVNEMKLLREEQSTMQKDIESIKNKIE